MPKRETWVQAPPTFSLVCKPERGEPLSTRAWRKLAVVQPPMTLSPEALVRQVVGTSNASEVMFLSAMVPAPKAAALASLVMTAAGALIRSKIVPRVTANASCRWPTNTLPGVAQPGMLML